MGANILISKIVANPSETSWSQAYSTLNLYIVLSIHSEKGEEDIVAAGKELLDKIQREYFSYEKKNLVNIKSAVEAAIAKEEKPISLILATIDADTVYIVIAGRAMGILKRDDKVGAIATGEEGKTVGFSGKLEPDDILIFETDDFSKKVPVEKFSQILDNFSVSEISETLAPLIHENSQGGEAAILIQYKSIEKEEILSSEANETKQEALSSPPFKMFPLKLPGLNFSTIKSVLPIIFKGKRAVVLLVFLLVSLLVLSIFFEKAQGKKKRREEMYFEIVSPLEKKYDEAIALTSLDKSLALDEFTQIKQKLEETSGKFETSTNEAKKINEFIGKVEGKIGELSGGQSVDNQKVVFENVDFVVVRSNTTVTASKDGKIRLLTSNGKLEKEIDSKNENLKTIGASKDSIFISGEKGITKTTRSSGTTKVVAENPKESLALDTFGQNLYSLNAQDKTIDKYVGSSASSYFTQDTKLNNPASMSIDGSIWIIDNGKIRKFTKGREDSFAVNGLAKGVSSNSLIFTGVDYDNIYILDRDNTRIISISKDGEFKDQYAWPELLHASSFAVDEGEKMIFVAINSKLYSFDL